jgi:hypothetical protein
MSICPSAQTIQTVVHYPVQKTHVEMSPQQISTHLMVYYVNDVPYYCYSHQPDILMPVYMPIDTNWFPQSEPQMVTSREYDAIGNIIDGMANVVGEVVKNEIDNLQDNITKDVKTCCFGIFKSSH